jgi:hypothetical protein
MKLTVWSLAALVLAAAPGNTAAQDEVEPRWSLSGGGGGVFRTVHQGSLGVHFRGGPVFQPAPSVLLEPALTGYWYGDSEHGGDLCPIEGCPPPRKDAISVLGLELGAAYRRLGADNFIYPMVGLGVYRVSAEDTAGVRLGANAGLVIPFQRSAVGPGLEIRYYRVFGDSRFKSMLPVSLRWSF